MDSVFGRVIASLECSTGQGIKVELDALAAGLMLVGFDGFTLSPCHRGTAAKPGAQTCLVAPLVLSGVMRARVAAEGPAALTRLS